MPLPIGLGHHPYLSAPSGLVDLELLHVPASRVLPPGPRGLPLAEADVSEVDLDFQRPRKIGARSIDACFGGFKHDQQGHAAITFSDVRLWFGKPYRWLMIYTSDRAPAGDRRRWVAVEPMTCPPDAFNNGIDVIRLEPGASVSAAWGIDRG